MQKTAVLSRSMEYAKKTEEFHIVVFSLKKHGLYEQKIGNLYLYPTNSMSRWLYVFDAIRLAKKIIVGNGFVRGASVITCQDPFECGFAGYKVATYFRLPLHLQVHTDFQSPYFKISFINRIRVALAKFLVPKAQGLRVVSEIIADSVKKSFPKIRAHMAVLPVFVDIEALLEAPVVENMRRDFLPFTFIIFMASRLTSEKRIGTALEVLKKVLNTTKDVGLVIAGDGPERKSLEAHAKTLGLSAHVQCIGWRENLISYYKTATMFLSTSEYEGYGMSLIEACACGCPIVTTQVGIAKTDLFKNGENCFVCAIHDVEGLSNAVLNLIQDHEKRELFKEKMQASIRRRAISKEEYAARYVALLQELIPPQDI